MAKILQPPPRFNHEEWTRSNLTKYANAEVERQGAERLVDESKRLDDETRRRVEKTQEDVAKKFQQRLDDIRYWKKELDDKLEGLVNEIDGLEAFRKRVDQALQATDEPLHIARQCLSNRERRLKIDLVHDDVQKELIKEVETLEGVQALLQRTKEEATEQQRLNRKAKFRLEQDLKDKFKAQHIDEFCENLKNNSHNLYYKDGAAKIEANSTSPDEWQDFSHENIENAERERFNSQNLRSNIDGILQQVCNDQTKQVDATNLAFARRIHEERDAKGKLEDHLNRVLTQIKQIEENIARLEKGISDKECPYKLNNTRLDMRGDRPNVELCRDPVQYRLIEEVHELESTLAQLRSRLHDSKDSLKGLTRNQLDLEEDINTKANTIFIDEAECMGMRKSISIQQY